MPPDYEITDGTIVSLVVTRERDVEHVMRRDGRSETVAVGPQSITVDVVTVPPSADFPWADYVALGGERFVVADVNSQATIAAGLRVSWRLRPVGNLPASWVEWAQRITPSRRAAAPIRDTIETTTHGDFEPSYYTPPPMPAEGYGYTTQRMSRQASKPTRPALVGQPKRRVISADDDGA